MKANQIDSATFPTGLILSVILPFLHLSTSLFLLGSVAEMLY